MASKEEPGTPDTLRSINTGAPARYIELDDSALLRPYHGGGRGKTMVSVIHGGDEIPAEYYQELVEKDATSRAEIDRYYQLDKDWGANQVAEKLAALLGTGGYLKVDTARVLLDFGRLPGSTRPDAEYLQRYAINHPFSSCLTHHQRQSLLKGCYDEISALFERHLRGDSLAIMVHTYDTYNPSNYPGQLGTKRPDVSLIFQSMSMQEKNRMPFGLFDPLYPDQLLEFTADRRLTARISLMLEKQGVSVSHNYPYPLPDGSVEVRAQVWAFFRYLQEDFRREFPDTALDASFEIVWDLLLDTNLRSSDSESLRSYIHMYRNAPNGRVREFERALSAYIRIQQYLESKQAQLVEAYLLSEHRLSTLTVEIRKDLVWNFKDTACQIPILGPEGLKRGAVDKLSTLIADAVICYYEKDWNQ